MTTPLLVLLVVSSLLSIGLLLWAAGSLRHQSPEGRRRGLQAATIAAAIVVVALVAARLL